MERDYLEELQQLGGLLNARGPLTQEDAKVVIETMERRVAEFDAEDLAKGESKLVIPGGGGK